MFQCFEPYELLNYWEITKICKPGSCNKQEQDQKINEIENFLISQRQTKVKFETFMKKGYCAYCLKLVKYDNQYEQSTYVTLFQIKSHETMSFPYYFEFQVGNYDLFTMYTDNER